MSLQLVRSFSDADYPFLITIDPQEANMLFGKYYFDHHSSVPRSASEGKVRYILALADIQNYQLFHEQGKIKLHLKTELDFNNVMIGLSESKELVHVVANDKPIAKKVLNSTCKDLRRMWKDSGLDDRVEVNPRADINGFEITTKDKDAYFQVQRDLKFMIS